MTRHVLRWVPFVLLSACTGPMTTECKPAPSITGSPTALVTAGYDYSGCVEAVHLGSWIVPYADSGIELSGGPEGAVVDGNCVRWHAPVSGAGRTVRFSVVTEEDPCGDRAGKSWDVTIVPPPALLSFDLDRDRVSPGATVNATAVFAGGDATVRVGNGPATPIPSSGAAIILGPVLDSVDVVVAVTDAAGDAVSATRRVAVIPDPHVASFVAVPATITIGDVSMLTWDTTGAVRVALVTGEDLDTGGSTPVSPIEDTTYLLQAWNELGVSTTAQTSVRVIPPPRIVSFAASPPEVTLGGATTLTPIFENGTAIVEHYLTSLDPGYVTPNETFAPLASGVAFVTPPQQGSDTYRLVVTNETGVRVSADVVVRATGPGTFQPAPMAPTDLHGGPALARLADGRILVVRTTPSAEGLDPDSWAWSGAIALATRHQWGSAVMLTGGAVLVAGGYEPAWPPPVVPFAEAELVDMASGASTVVGPTVTGTVFRPSIVPFDDGSALVLGFAGPLLHEPGAAALSAIDVTGGPGSSARGCRLADGRVLVVEADAAWLYIPASGTFEPTGRPLAYRDAPVLACLRDGSAIVGGGTDTTNMRVLTLEQFDPAAGSFTSWPWDPLLRKAVELHDGRVLLLGVDAHVYDPASRQGAPVGRPIYPWSWYFAGPDAVVLDDGRVLVVADGAATPEIFTP